MKNWKWIKKNLTMKNLTEFFALVKTIVTLWGMFH